MGGGEPGGAAVVGRPRASGEGTVAGVDAEGVDVAPRYRRFQAVGIVNLGG